MGSVAAVFSPVLVYLTQCGGTFPKGNLIVVLCSYLVSAHSLGDKGPTSLVPFHLWAAYL